MTVALRRATSEDVPFLVRLVSDDDVAPFLAAVRPSTEDDIGREVARSKAQPDAFGVYVVEVDGRAAGTVTWERVNKRSRIASVSGFALDPAFRGRGLGDEAARMLQHHLIREIGRAHV